MNAIAGTLGWNQVVPYRLAGLRWALFFAGFTAFAIAAPYVCHQFGIAGTVILPMHFAVLFAAMVMGVRGGVLTALASPALSLTLTGMPPAGMLLPMTIELTVYALVAGWLVHRRHARVITGLACAMIAGRVATLGLFALGVNASPSASVLLKNLFLVGLPGIVAQLILLPIAASKIASFLGKTDA